MKKESKPIRVSFDFDGTLSRTDVQEYAKELIGRGIDVIVITSRFDEESKIKHVYSSNPTNEDLYAITDSLGIKRENIHFTNMEDKVNYLHNDIAWHLDDDKYELWEIFNSDLNVDSIDVNNDDWRWMCNFSIGGRE